MKHFVLLDENQKRPVIFALFHSVIDTRFLSYLFSSRVFVDDDCSIKYFNLFFRDFCSYSFETLIENVGFSKYIEEIIFMFLMNQFLKHNRQILQEPCIM